MFSNIVHFQVSEKMVVLVNACINGIEFCVDGQLIQNINFF